ncbi:ABR104Wp [Eremothecium gossypii ATCC 10895]|uniref:Alcohol-sensitive RING finger protein 1 n=1 Tax=Eremothecium gossypii (strain ATCC 10895 / CBS 109.51 / FGSC 9923 / NRRL Y-1056) TaxID=284811 RepID=ASR1_EREGS|nr:ABR104Wp [Eremothecium gossypii ATCC 10895]Q75DC2.1 RecName: Full=Alcohol-sensitive RING finger protein 1 [Eremothecium gossypii ATCC 10895]AAS50875.1 ABR104Wp [Eremothecium gossypii ATCC 10895]AEY95164.1 FABR104Wp [Eremothecium gossypii FDAG1]
MLKHISSHIAMGCPQDECSICWESMPSGVGRLMPCGHEYHLACIRKWFHLHSGNRSCPVCRTEASVLVDTDHEVKIDLSVGQLLDFYGLLDEIGSQLLAITLQDHSTQDDEVNEEGLAEQRAQLTLVQCGICGEMNGDIDTCCNRCHHMYHHSCLGQLLVEVNAEREQGWSHCIFCYEQLVPLYISGARRVLSLQDRGVHRGRVRNNRSILTELIYERSGVLVHGIEDQHASQHDINDIEHSWHLLEQNRQRKQLEYQDKCKIQAHVRRILDHYYHCAKVTKAQYTFINKKVSQTLYALSRGVYPAVDLDYDGIAKTLILDEMEKLSS